jgi:CBS domain-containing protein
MKKFPLKSIIKRQFLDAKIKLLHPKKAITIRPNTSVRDAIKLMVDQKFGSVIISANDTEYLGIFTERDVMKGFAEFGHEFLLMPVSKKMSSPLQTQMYYASIARAIYSMSVGGFRHLGIIESDSKLCVISVKDILDYLYKALTKKVVADEFSTFFDENSIDLFFLSPVSELKPKNPFWVLESATLKEVVTLMSAKKVGCVMVGANKKKASGIFTERDFLQYVSEVGTTVDVVTVGACMTTSPKTALRSSTVSHVLNMMCESGYRHIPIVDEAEAIQGILSVLDFFDFLAEHIIAELEASQK